MKVNDIFKTNPACLGSVADKWTPYYSYVHEIHENRVIAYSFVTKRARKYPSSIGNINSNYIKLINLPEDINTETFRVMLVSKDEGARAYAIEIIKQYDK